MDAIYTTQQLTVAGTAVQKGDVYKGRTVDIIKVGHKNVELLDADGKRIAYGAKDHGVLIERQVETEDSVRNRRRHARNQAIRNWFDQYEINREQKKVLAKLTEQAEKGCSASSFAMTDLVAAQAEDDVHAELYRYLENAVGRMVGDNPDETLDEAAVVDLYIEECKRKLVQVSGYGLSRSTSVVSNVMEDALRQKLVEFIERGHMWIY